MLLLAARRVFWCTILGILTVVLIGPILSVLGTILPFALIGGIVWLIWKGGERLVRRFSPAKLREQLAQNPVLPAVGRGVRHAVQEGIRQGKELTPVVCQRAWAAGRGAEAMLRQGVQHCRNLAPNVRGHVERFREKMARLGRAAARILVEVTCGAVVGGLVAWYAVGTTEDIVAIGALVGGALGFVVGGPARQPSRELVAE